MFLNYQNSQKKQFLYGVLIIPGDLSYPNRFIGELYIHLNFSCLSEKDITKRVKRGINAIGKCSNTSRSSKASLYSTINPFL